MVGWQYAIAAEPITSLSSCTTFPYLSRHAAILDQKTVGMGRVLGMGMAGGNMGPVRGGGRRAGSR